MAIISVPKPFRGAAGAAQHAALRSWTHLRPKVEILLASSDEGVQEAAALHGATHLPVLCNQLGTPLLNSVLSSAEAASSAQVLLLVNADIILFDDVLEVIEEALGHMSEFLVVGRRSNMNVDLTGLAQKATSSDLLRSLRLVAHRDAPLHSRWALDYFGMTRNVLRRFGAVPAFAFGRPAYDNWLLQKAIAQATPVIDASALVVAAHQHHAYTHVTSLSDHTSLDTPQEKAWAIATQKRGREANRDVWEKMASDEIELNRALAGPQVKLGTCDHASYVALACP